MTEKDNQVLEQEQVEERPRREKSEGEMKTDAFKMHLQAIINDTLGVKVSKETSWNLFKTMIYGSLQFTCMQEDKRVPLSGVGTFEVIKAGARGSKKEEGKTNTPKFRLYFSSTLERALEELMGERQIPEDFKGIGLYNTLDALEKASGMAVVNAEWLAGDSEEV